MSYNLKYTIQVAGAHTYSKCVGEVLLLFKSEKRHLVISMAESGMMSLQLKTLIIQAFKAICELLAEGEIHWTGEEVVYPDSY